MKGNYFRNYLKKRKKRGRLSKDYQNKSFTNPFFNKKKKVNKTQGFKVFSKRNLILVLILASIVVVFFTKLFQLKSSELKDSSRVAKEQIDQFIWQEYFPKSRFKKLASNLLFLSKKKLELALIQEFNFNDVIVSKKYFNTLNIAINERSLNFIWENPNSLHYLDRQACLIKEIDVAFEDFANYPILFSAEAEASLNKDSCLKLSEEYLEKSLDLYNRFKTLNEELEILHFILDSSFYSIKIQLSSGPEVFFNINDDFDRQIERLRVIRKEKGEEDFNKLNYIDLRYGDTSFLGL